MQINPVQLIKDVCHLKKIEQKSSKYATIATVALTPLVNDVFEKKSGENMTYDLEKIDLFRNQNQKTLYVKLTEGLTEPEYVSYDWDYMEDDRTVRCYDFYDISGIKRKSVEIALDGFPNSITLYNETGKITNKVDAFFQTSGHIELVKTFFDDNENEVDSQIIKFAI